MGLNISGLVINQNFQENIQDLQNILGWDLIKVEDIDFETVSSSNKEEDICDVYFTDNGTLIFLNADLCTESYALENLNSLSFIYSETSMASHYNYSESGISKFSNLEIESEIVDQTGTPLEIETEPYDNADIIFTQIELILGKSYWDIEPNEKLYRYRLLNLERQNKYEAELYYKSIQNATLNNQKHVSYNNLNSNKNITEYNIPLLIGAFILILILMGGLVYFMNGIYELK
jgi:hypothetical protein